MTVPPPLGSDQRLERATAGFTPLARRGSDPGAQGGCALLLALVLLLVGGGILAAFFVNPAGKGDMWVMPVVGGAFAALGLVGLYAAVRGLRGAKIPRTEVCLEGGHVVAPGARVRLRLRQPGPIAIASLKVRLVCERVYKRRVRPSSSSTVEDQELLFEREVLHLRDERVPNGGALDREVLLELPAGARETGPAAPDGKIRWTLEVWGETGFMRAIQHPFELDVRSSDREAPEAGGGAAAEPPATGAMAEPAGPRPSAKGSSSEWGCIVIGLGFAVCGSFLVWMYFSGAVTSRGNPVAGLIAGSVFAVLGLVILGVGIAALRRSG